MKPKYWYAAIVVLSLLVVGTQPALGTKYIPSDLSIGTWDSGTRTYTLTTDVSETIEIVEDNLTLDGNGHTVTGSGTGNGVYLYRRTGVTVKNLNVQGFRDGICLDDSSNNTLTGNTVTSNSYYGIILSDSNNNVLTGNTASNNGCGIYLWFSYSNTLTGNTTSSNWYGIASQYSDSNILTGNTVTSNYGWGIYLDASSTNRLTGNTMLGNPYNFTVEGWGDIHFDHDIDTSNAVDTRPIYYVKNAVGEVYDSSTNAGIFYAINCENITVRDLTFTGNGMGLFLCGTHNSMIENVSASNNYGSGIRLLRSSSNTLTGNTASNNYHGIYVSRDSDSNTLTGNTCNSNGDCGIYLYLSSSNTLTCNTISNSNRGIRASSTSSNTLTSNTISNSDYGIFLGGSSSNTLTGNTASNNDYGIYLHYYSNDNEVYNNNFIDNSTQAYVDGGSGNVFNLPAPEGGNYWSDWTSPDNDGDGFVDNPYVFDGGQDNLPWVSQDGWLNQPPVAGAGPDKTVIVGQTVTFDASGSYDPDGTIASYDWDFGDYTAGSGEITTHEYSFAGVYTVTLTVIDNDAATDTDTAIVTVQTPAEATQDLMLYVLTLNLPYGIENSLVPKLEAAMDSLDRDRENAAKNQLNAFINQLEAQRDKKIPEEDADALIAGAQQIIDQLESG